MSFVVNSPFVTEIFPQISIYEFSVVSLDTVNVSLNVEDPITLRVDERVVASVTLNVEERVVSSLTVTAERVVVPVTLSDAIESHGLHSNWN